MRAQKTHTEIRQDQIARTALEVLATEGMKGLRVAEVARRVGLATSGVYRHYRSKDQILEAILDYVHGRLQANVLAVAQTEGDALERLHLLLSRHIDLIGQHQSIPQVLFEQLWSGPTAQRTKLQGLIQGYLGEVAALVRAGQKEGIVRSDLDPVAVAPMFLGIIQPAVILRRLVGEEFNLHLQIEAAWQVFRRGIQADRNGRRQRKTIPSNRNKRALV